MSAKGAELEGKERRKEQSVKAWRESWLEEGERDARARERGNG